MKWKKLNAKGLGMNQAGFSPATILMMFVLFFVYYIFIEISMPFLSGSLFPALENYAVPNATLIRLIFEFIPLLLAVYIFVWPVMKSGVLGGGGLGGREAF